MLWVPKKGILRMENNISGRVSAILPGTQVTTGAGTAKGSAAVLIASTSFDAYWVTILAFNYGASATQSRCTLDIMVGAATEEVIIPDLLCGFCGDNETTGVGPKIWNFPLYIPAGSRLTAKAGGDRATTALGVGIQLYGGDGYPPWRVGSKVTTYGIAVPAGATVNCGYSETAGNPDNQITAATTEDHFAFMPSFQLGAITAVSVAKTFLVGMGMGASAEDYIGGAHQGYYYQCDTIEHMGGPTPSMPVFADVPSGTRLTMEGSCNFGSDAAEPQGAIHAVS